MIWRRDQRVIVPGFGLMDGEFTFWVGRIDGLLRRFRVEAGLMSGWMPMADFRWDPAGERWVHKDLPLDVTP